MDEWGQEDKEYFGCSPSPIMGSFRTPLPANANGLEGNWRSENGGNPTKDMYTGRSLSPSGRKSHADLFDTCSVPSTASLAGPKQPPNMCGRSTPESKAPSLNSGKDRFKGTRRSTGIEYGMPPKQEILWKSLPIYVFKVIGLSDKLAQTMRSQLEWSELAMCSGVELELASRGKLGLLREWELILKIRGQSSGVATKAKKMLLSMNSVEVSISHTCSGGWTVIQSLWKLREVAGASMLPVIGSRPTLIRETGIPKRAKNKRQPCYDV